MGTHATAEGTVHMVNGTSGHLSTSEDQLQSSIRIDAPSPYPRTKPEEHSPELALVADSDSIPSEPATSVSAWAAKGQRLDELADLVQGLASQCRELATGLRGSDFPPSESDEQGRSGQAAELLEEAAATADTMARLLWLARDHCVESADLSPLTSSPISHNGTSHTEMDPMDLGSNGHQPTSDTFSAQSSPVESPTTVFSSLGFTGHGLSTSSSKGNHAAVTNGAGFAYEAAFSELASAGSANYPAVLPLGAAGGQQAASVARQVEASRRHLQAALAVGHQVADNRWQSQVLEVIEQVLGTVSELGKLATDTLAPCSAAATFPGESRFLCTMPWQDTPISSPETSLMPATVDHIRALLAAIGYPAQIEDNPETGRAVVISAETYSVRIVPRHLPLAGVGDWTCHLEWAAGEPQWKSDAEVLGPVALTDDEVARRVDDAIRRRILATSQYPN